MQNVGVDYDKRCQKYRVRLTRDGIVYLIAYTESLKEACQLRKEALQKYESKEKFEYLHSYETPSRRNRINDEDYLYQLGVSTDNSSPYRTLLVAVLIQAIKDRLSDDEEIKEEAKRWFESRRKETLQFSFLDLCEELAVQPNKVKQLISSSERDKKPSRKVVGRRLVRSTKPIDKKVSAR